MTQKFIKERFDDHVERLYELIEECQNGTADFKEVIVTEQSKVCDVPRARVEFSLVLGEEGPVTTQSIAEPMANVVEALRGGGEE